MFAAQIDQHRLFLQKSTSLQHYRQVMPIVAKDPHSQLVAKAVVASPLSVHI